MSASRDGVFLRHRAMAGADAARMKPTRFAPYRKIVGHEEKELGNSGYSHIVEVLECGHTMRPRSDMIGETYPERRRCVVTVRLDHGAESMAWPRQYRRFES